MPGLGAVDSCGYCDKIVVPACGFAMGFVCHRKARNWAKSQNAPAANSRRKSQKNVEQVTSMIYPKSLE